MGALHIEPQENQQQHARTAALFEGPERRAKQPQPDNAEQPPAFDVGRAKGAGGGDPAAVQAVYGGMYGGAAAAKAAAKPEDQADGKKPAPLGLGSYEVVPDDHKGPLKPNQIRKSQYDDLKNYDFDKLNVVADGAAKDGKLANDQMTQAQFQQLAQAWLHIGQGQGMHITGSAADQQTFRRMLRDSMGDSPTVRNLVSAIGNDADPKHRVEAKVGRSQRGVLVDSFSDNAVDLADIEEFPIAPSKDHKNEATRGEQLVHILAERRAALTSRDPSDFDPAHDEATRQHNAYRAERGQARELSARPKVKNGKNYGVFSYDDGTKEEIEINAQSDIANIARP